jgi:2-oxoglutarate dehydrogenase E1 component
MGAWTYVSPRLRASTGNALTIRYVGRPERASPAEGYSSSHKRDQDRIVSEVLAELKRGKRDTGAKRESGKREAGSPT